MSYKLIRSNRRSIAAQIKNGELVIRAPLTTPLSRIEEFVSEHSEWIEKNLSRSAEYDELPPISFDELKDLAKKACEYIPQKAEYYARILGVTYGRITIRNQRSKWGSCSSKKNLNFNCLLMLTPPEVIDSVIVHELCHLKEMNHSKRFYALVLSVYPDYYKHDKWLKQNGNALMTRMENGLKKDSR